MIRYIICIVIALWVLTGCSNSTGGVLKTGISKSEAPLYINNRDLTVYPNELDIISDVDKKTIHFGYVHLESAADQYMKGKAIVAVAGCIDSQKQIWVLITTPDQVRTNRSSVQAAVQIFLTHAKQNGYTEFDLDEKNVKQLLQLTSKVNLSWFIDRSFMNVEKNKQ